MPTVPSDPSKCYSEQLFRLGHGYPLWDPEPITGQDPVCIGDVGFITPYGQFFRLFNATRSPEDNVNKDRSEGGQGGGVPDGFKEFMLSDWTSNSKSNALSEGPYSSSTVNCVNTGAHLNIHGVGACFDVECTDEQGAILVLKHPAHREEQMHSRRMSNYMRHNHANWYAFATETHHLELNKEDIIFVRGFVKTTEWAMAVFTHQGHSAKFTISVDASAVKGGVSFSQKKGAKVSPHFKTGPASRVTHHPTNPQPKKKKKRNNQEPEISSTGEEDKADQCIFLHYYKMKLRLGFWPSVVKAGAGPHELPRRSDDFDEGDSGGNSTHNPMYESADVEDPTIQRKVYDPVEFVLDYILNHSEANVAIASDDDILILCQDERGIPEDIPAFLEYAQPHIEVTEDGLGTLSRDMLMHESLTERPPASQPTDNVAPEAPDHPPSVGSNNLPTEKATANWRGSSNEIVLEENTGGVSALVYSPDTRYIVSGSEDSDITIWDAHSGHPTHVGHGNPICSLAFAPDSSKFVSGSRDGQAIIWDVRTGEEKAMLDGHEGLIYSVAWSPDGTMVASASVDSTIRIWDVETGASRAVAQDHNAVVMLVEFSPDSKWIASASADYSARIWNVADGSQVSTLEGHEGVIYSISFSPDSRRIVTGSDDGTARIWMAESGEELITLREHTGSVWAAAFSPDNMRVLTAASDGTMTVCDSYSGENYKTVDCGDPPVNAAAFSADGCRICASAGDNVVRVWDVDGSQTPIAELHGHSDKVSHLRFASNGGSLVSASDDSTLRIWQLPPHGIVRRD